MEENLIILGELALVELQPLLALLFAPIGVLLLSKQDAGEVRIST